MTKATGGFELASWEEETYEELEGGGKLTRASVTQTFTGDIEGEGAEEWLMAYGKDGTAHFVGFQRVRGAIGDRKGSFVMETIGDFDGTVAAWTCAVCPGPGPTNWRASPGKERSAHRTAPKRRSSWSIRSIRAVDPDRATGSRQRVPHRRSQTAGGPA